MKQIFRISVYDFHTPLALTLVFETVHKIQILQIFARPQTSDFHLRADYGSSSTQRKDHAVANQFWFWVGFW